MPWKGISCGRGKCISTLLATSFALARSISRTEFLSSSFLKTLSVDPVWHVTCPYSSQPLRGIGMIEQGSMSTNEAPRFFWAEVGTPAMRDLQKVVESAATTDLPIMIIGEHGTGRTVLAREIHARSARRSYPITVVSGKTVSADSMRSLLSDAGACGGGTLVIEDVASLQESTQSTLLGWLRQHAITSAAPRLISVSTPPDSLSQEQPQLIEELQYRLSSIALYLPPLRDRREDIPELATYLLSRFAADFHRPRPGLSSKILSFFNEHHWGGNVRELEGALKMLLAVEDEEMVVTMLKNSSLGTAARSVPVPLKQASRAAAHARQRQVIADALARTEGNRKRAAKELNISYKALLYKLKQFGLPPIAATDTGEEQ